jgi:2-polyprenyl-6-methoxyphenol hydroxylase-like FAD-dependent oxidoreductase
VADRFDVIVVGARCAGSSLAALLARQGLSVAVVERAKFPKDTLSTHIFQGPAINFLRRLGVLDRVRETGAESFIESDTRQEEFEFRVAPPQRPGDEGAFMSVRRFVLDPILLDAARDAGAKTMMSTTVTDVLREGGRVAGVKATYRGQERELKARLVVGADGRNSTVAELVGARKYNVVPSERFGYWGFFEGWNRVTGPDVVYHRWDGRYVIAMPCDGGLYEVIVLPDNSFLPEFKQDREAAFLAHARACRPVAERIEGARRVGKLFGMLTFEGFFREAAGPGWVLAGDSGHFKDPAPGQGISDAFRQVEALAPVIAGAIQESGQRLDSATAGWARWRDRDAAEHYWLATDFGAGGRAPGLNVEILRRMGRRQELEKVGDVIQHRALPSRVFTPGKLLTAAAAMMLRPGADGRQALREVSELVVADTQRRRLNRKPEFVASGEHRDAGETEVSKRPVAA